MTTAGNPFGPGDTFGPELEVRTVREGRPHVVVLGSGAGIPCQETQTSPSYGNGSRNLRNMNEPVTTVDFRAMIRGPFRDCPKCGKPGYGVLSVYAGHYIRRCRECWHTSDHIPLPAPKKRVIYLDQFAISEMAKLNDTGLKKSPAAQVGKCWQEIMEPLRLLVGAQVLVCPESECHFHESLVMAGGYKSLKAMYEDMAGGVSFLPPGEIQTRQICRALRSWLVEKPLSPMTLADATTGEIHAWRDIVRVSLNLDWSSMVDALRQARGAIDQSLQNVFQQWQGDQQLKFDDWVREETFGVGKGLLVSFGNAFAAVKQQPDDVDAFLRFTHHSMHRILRNLREGGTPAHEEYERLCEFFRSAVFSDLPSVKLSALMFAAVACQAAHQGRTKPPDRGFSTDVAAISAFLPYCDAMFIDKGCWTILTQNPVRYRLGFSTKLFSTQNAGEFIAYLGDIGHSASPEHGQAIREVYGDGLAEKLGGGKMETTP